MRRDLHARLYVRVSVCVQENKKGKTCIQVCVLIPCCEDVKIQKQPPGAPPRTHLAGHPRGADTFKGRDMQAQTDPKVCVCVCVCVRARARTHTRVCARARCDFFKWC